ncbi:Metallo-dependent hydrolase [Dendrothele bispora CBS 962.96]|uniref:Metallo-dependent hydrolase n=1 Tax=Dendrothele bispora (strain CBS 962.96) TaxID=1314807 RepID=A0A4S8L8P3_DENBC|nr:Metallo-dependent hydrolase [Dendrothele bispora CBS 962.96]
MRCLPLSLTLASLRIPLANAASTLLKGGTIISFDETSQTPLILRNHSLLVTDDRIASIFPSSSSSSRIPPNTTTIDVAGKILSPGFIDTHRHGWQTAFRTIASNTTLSEYTVRYGATSQAQHLFTPSDMYFGQFAGMLESLNAGVTSIVDHAHGTFSKETAGAYFNGTVDSGARVFWCYGIHAIQNGFSVNDQIEDFKELKNQLVSRGETITTLGIAYDGFSSSSLDEIQTVMELARESNISVLTTHYLGGPWITANSPTLLNSFQPSFLNNTPFPIIFSHGSFMTAQDAILLRQTNQYLSTTPESEMHYGHTHPHSFLIQDQASLGIDTHFTYSADMVTQARLWLQSTRLFLFSQVLVQDWEIPQSNPMSVNQAFHLITRSGALALRRNDLGVLVEGAKADIVLFDGDSPNMLGWEDPVAAIILHSNVGDVTDVMVDGEWRKREGELVAKEGTIMRAVRTGFLDSAKRIQGLWAQMPIPEFSGISASGVPFGMPRREDVVRGEQDGY